ncbi:hypothetical protein M2373_000286 [Chryseobacterium sp. JUb7]|nr:hypothetical protein [Chryseobacterium sp. JUb7]
MKKNLRKKENLRNTSSNTKKSNFALYKRVYRDDQNKKE